MRFLLLFLLVLAGVGAGVFYNNTAAREAFRGWRVADDERERFEAYEKGKTLFKYAWTGAANAQFQAWGDDPGETAGRVDADGVAGDVWMARGHFTTKDGTKGPEQWCLAFDRGTGVSRGLLVEQKAEDYLRKLDSGELRKKPVQTAGAPPSVMPGQAAPAPTPSGSWMWSKENRSPLDQPARRGSGS